MLRTDRRPAAEQLPAENLRFRFFFTEQSDHRKRVVLGPDLKIAIHEKDKCKN
jgi:hypothetical protein